MIKINLLQDTNVGTARDISIAGSSGLAVDVKDLLVKGLMVILPVLGVWVYNEVTVSKQQDEVRQAQAKIQTVDEELKKLDVQVKEVEKFLEAKRKLDSQLNTIKQLSKERLRIVKSMDAIQSLIPKKVWLTGLMVKDTAIEIDGQATDDIVIADFMRDLEESVYFANVSLAVSEEARGVEGSVKKFVVKCNLENM